MRKGLFIVLYGPQGVGKSKQLEILEDTLHRFGIHCRRIKYPIYTLEPTGPELDRILHKGGSQPEEVKMQEMFAQNRRDFEPTVKNWINNGVCVLAEDYKGTGVAWGMVRGLSLEQSEEINKDAVDPDLAILLDGPKRVERMDGSHPYEDEEEWYQISKTYRQLADRYGWVRVGGDAPFLTVAGRIYAVVKPVLAVRG